MEKLSEAIHYIDLLSNNEDTESFMAQYSEEDRIQILFTAKKVLAHMALNNGSNMAGKCYECEFRRNIPGSVHSQCVNKMATVIGADCGIQKGWFFHPFDFDPVWLCYCDGFQKINS